MMKMKKVEKTNWDYSHLLESMIKSILENQNFNDIDNVLSYIKEEIKEINKYYYSKIFNYNESDKDYIKILCILLKNNMSHNENKIKKEINNNVINNLLYSYLRCNNVLYIINNINYEKIKRLFENELFHWPILKMTTIIVFTSLIILVTLLYFLFDRGLNIFILLLLFIFASVYYISSENNKITKFTDIDYDVGISLLYKILNSNNCLSIETIDYLISIEDSNIEYSQNIKSNTISSILIGIFGTLIGSRIIVNTSNMTISLNYNEIFLMIPIVCIIVFLITLIFNPFYNPKKDKFYHDCLKIMKFQTYIES